MTYEVIRNFTDKATGTQYVIGDTYPNEQVDDKRFDELFSKNNKYNKKYIKIVVSDGLTKAELVQIAEDHNIEVSKKDTKNVIVEKLEG
ncbi:hypothetical protein [Staphylococcus saprophyticus]|uniref:hypothetical protein n=1 Tax=Staphylococcus saprophyticus TaxID=29385 RepID=UPI0008538B31|nr:hypothetical protein [Staphylococcus saprophyticus]MDW4355189.1 hypothetical protein [Staphylococcus saprophyticus]OEK18803.1 hypothetical protein ASS81_11140 [Staphylococcus saprophyticus]